jgi:hypothetical protein
LDFRCVWSRRQWLPEAVVVIQGVVAVRISAVAAEPILAEAVRILAEAVRILAEPEHISAEAGRILRHTQRRIFQGGLAGA